MSDSEDLGLQSPGTPEERPKREKNIELTSYAPSHASSEVLVGRVPAFLAIEPHPFDTTAELEQPINPNTVRWKYGRNASGDMDKLSNARIIEWDDGSRTLELGAEQFELRSQAPNEPVFITFDNKEALDTAYIVDQTITVVPTSTASATHTRLAKQLADKVNGSQVYVRSHATTDDPEQMQREYAQAESAKDKARRKLEQKREQEEDAQPRSHTRAAADSDEEEEEEESEESEEEDEDSEESDHDRSSRLQAIKRGADGEDSEPRRRKVVDDDSD